VSTNLGNYHSKPPHKGHIHTTKKLCGHMVGEHDPKGQIQVRQVSLNKKNKERDQPSCIWCTIFLAKNNMEKQKRFLIHKSITWSIICWKIPKHHGISIRDAKIYINRFCGLARYHPFFCHSLEIGIRCLSVVYGRKCYIRNQRKNIGERIILVKLFSIPSQSFYTKYFSFFAQFCRMTLHWTQCFYV